MSDVLDVHTVRKSRGCEPAGLCYRPNRAIAVSKLLSGSGSDLPELQSSGPSGALANRAVRIDSTIFARGLTCALTSRADDWRLENQHAPLALARPTGCHARTSCAMARRAVFKAISIWNGRRVHDAVRQLYYKTARGINRGSQPLDRSA